MNKSRWRKSSYSGGVHQNCVEVAQRPAAILLRDSQHPHLGYLTAPAHEWAAFLTAVRTGEVG
jgi:hypothetical protein